MENKETEIDLLDLSTIQPLTISHYKLNIMTNALGEHWQIPVMVAKGHNMSPVLGITAALHGNELNGISIVHQLFQNLNVQKLQGTIVAIPILNIPGFMRGEREFNDGKDLNRIMPGKEYGTSAEIYCFHIIEKVVKQLNFLIDLHTASFGRINSLYVRANFKNAMVARMAQLQEPDIIVNAPASEGTLRRSAMSLGIPTITVEVGDPYIFQKKHIRPSIFGINNVLVDLGMLDGKMEEIEGDPVICRKAYWVYSDCGGILEVFPKLTETVNKGQQIAKISNVFGETIRIINSPEDAIVVAKSTNPMCQAGSRVIHLGVLWDESTDGPL